MYVSTYSWDDGVRRDTSHGASDANNYTVQRLQKQRGESRFRYTWTRMRTETTAWKKKGGVKGFLTDRDFFDTISSRASPRNRALSCYPLSSTKLCWDTRNESLCVLMIHILLIVTSNIARIQNAIVTTLRMKQVISGAYKNKNKNVLRNGKKERREI